MDHPFRRNKSAFFKNREENSPPLDTLTGDEIWECASSLPKGSDHQGKVLLSQKSCIVFIIIFSVLYILFRLI